MHYYIVAPENQDLSDEEASAILGSSPTERMIADDKTIIFGSACPPEADPPSSIFSAIGEGTIIGYGTDGLNPG